MFIDRFALVAFFNGHVVVLPQRTKLYAPIPVTVTVQMYSGYDWHNHEWHMTAFIHEKIKFRWLMLTDSLHDCQYSAFMNSTVLLTEKIQILNWGILCTNSLFQDVTAILTVQVYHISSSFDGWQAECVLSSLVCMCVYVHGGRGYALEVGTVLTPWTEPAHHPSSCSVQGILSLVWNCCHVIICSGGSS